MLFVHSSRHSALIATTALTALCFVAAPAAAQGIDVTVPSPNVEDLAATPCLGSSNLSVCSAAIMQATDQVLGNLATDINNQVNSQISTITSDISNLQGGLGDTNANVSTLSNQVSAAQGQTDTDITDLQTTVTNLETGNDGPVRTGSLVNSPVAAGTGSIAGGDGAVATAGSAAYGSNANASGALAVAVGANATGTGASAIAIGDNASAQPDNSVALGAGAVATNKGDLALGAGSVTDTVHTGQTSAFGGTAAANPTSSTSAVSVGSAGAERQIQNIAAGVISQTSTDAVNGSQLYSVVQGVNTLGIDTAAALGGTTTYDASTGKVSGFSASIDNGTGPETYSDVTSAVEAASQAGHFFVSTNGGATQTVGYEDTLAFNNGSSGNIKITQNGSQITIDTNPDLTANSLTILGGPSIAKSGINAAGTKITNLAAGDVTATSTDAITGSELYPLVNDTAGSVRYGSDGSLYLTPQGAAYGEGTTASGPIALHNVATGAVSKTSSDAINGSQLWNSADSVAAALGGGSTVTSDGRVTSPTYQIGSETYNSVGAAIGALTSTTSKEVQYDTVGGVRQNSITLQGGSSGPVTIHNVAAGTAPTDAVNVAQLNSGLTAMSTQDRAYTDREVGVALRRANAAGSTAMAAAGLAFADQTKGEGSVAAGMGTFRDSVSFAGGLAYRLTDAIRVKATVSYTPSTGDVGASASVGYLF